jgi:RNA polymerase sigma-70 factor (ECF subfamily)
MRNSTPERPVSSLATAPVDRIGELRLTRLFESLRPELLRFALWLTRDRAIAEDVVQESLLRAWRSRDALKDPSCSRAWLLTIVRREHARLYERKRLELVSLNDATEHEGGALLSQDDSEVHALRGAILQLPIEYREPLIMQVLGGFSIDEIARELSLSASAVLTRLFRARNKLRALYGMTPAPDNSANEESP